MLTQSFNFYESFTYEIYQIFLFLFLSTGNESQAIWLDDVECAIGEVCITSCQRCPTAEQHNCLHTEDITVKCGMQRCIDY